MQQKGRMKLKKIGYDKEDSIKIKYVGRRGIKEDVLGKIIKPLKIKYRENKLHTIHKRVGVRMGRGKSPIIGLENKIRENKIIYSIKTPKKGEEYGARYSKIIKVIKRIKNKMRIVNKIKKINRKLK